MRLVAVQRWPVVPNAPQSAPSAQFEVGVVEDDLRVFAAHFEGDGFECGGGALGYERADFAGASETDRADVWMLNKRGAGGRAVCR